MRLFAATVSFGVGAAAAVSFADSQQVTPNSGEVSVATKVTVDAAATNKKKVVHVGFLIPAGDDRGDAESDEYKEAIKTDSHLDGEGRNACMYCRHVGVFMWQSSEL